MRGGLAAFVTAIVTALGSMAATVARAEPACVVGKPHATLTMGLETPYAAVESRGAGYADAACGLYLVDLEVPRVSSGGEGFGPRITVAGAYYGLPGNGAVLVAKAECASYSDRLEIYARTAGRWRLVGGGERRGRWIAASNHCELEEQPGYKPPTLVPGGDDQTYRVAFGVRLGATWRKVGLAASHEKAPPTPSAASAIGVTYSSARMAHR
jgi:hypothetical protein